MTYVKMKGRMMARNTQMQVDDIPDELGDEQATTVPAAAANGQRPTSSGLSLDALGEMGFNDDRDEETRLKLTPPTGDWLKSDRWKFQKVVYADDCEPGDVDPEGRTIFVVSGKPDARQANGMEYQPHLFLRMSPDLRFKPDKPEEIDNSHKLFIKAKDVYMSLKGEKCRTFAQLINMLEEDQYIVRTMNGDSGPIVVEMKAQVARRR
jgi:hypothetical protein